jgi:hypothetical protein
MSIVPKGARSTEGRVLVRTPDEMFDARFVTRSDNPTQAKMFTSGKTVMQARQKVCCSAKTFLTVTPGAVELSELTIPEPYTSRHITDHIGQMGQLARQLGEMPGSETMKVRAMQREGSSWLVRGAVAFGAIAAVVTVVAATQDFGKLPRIDAGQDATLPAGILPSDAQYMTKLQGWRLAEPSDFSGAATAWLRDNGKQPAGRITGDFTGQGGGDAAYLLINDETGKRRVAIVGHGAAYFDVDFPQVAAIGHMSSRLIESTEWAAPLIQPPDGDGLVIVFDASDPNSAIVLFLKDGRILSGKPADFQRVRLE